MKKGNKIDDLFALCNLVGKTLDGWNVKTKLPEPDTSRDETGGNFSVCYIVEKDGEEFFMKVLDLRKSIYGNLPYGMTRLQFIQRYTTEFNYEKNLSAYCDERRIKGVISYKGNGDIVVQGYDVGDVSYIVYEKADGDIRKILNLSKKIVFSEKLKLITSKLKSLHDTAVGIQQLHKNGISHQDIKPSNVLSIGDMSKLGDLGRSLCLDPNINCPYSLIEFNGDWTYAPPEAVFRYNLADEKERLYQMDNYMLGSLIVYYISGVSFNTLMEQHLPMSMINMFKSGITYEQAKVDVVNAYHEALLEFEKDIPIQDIKEELIRIVEYLCNPIVEKRGHPKNLNARNITPNYDLRRTCTELDKLLKKAEIGLLKK